MTSSIPCTRKDATSSAGVMAAGCPAAVRTGTQGSGHSPSRTPKGDWASHPTVSLSNQYAQSSNSASHHFATSSRPVIGPASSGSVNLALSGSFPKAGR